MVGDFMLRRIEEFFEEKTDNISFIQLREDSNLNINGYNLEGTLPMPILINKLVKEIKDGDAVEELNFDNVIEGMIYTLGVNPNFEHRDTYLEILKAYDNNIEGYILSEGINKVKNNNLDDGIVYLRCLINIDKENVKGLYAYGFALEEKSIKYFNNKNINEGNVFFSESTNHLEKILDIDDTFELAYYKLGYHYRNTKQYKKAEIMWDKFINMTKDEELLEEIQLQLQVIEDDVQYEEGYNLVLRGQPKEGLDKLLPLKEKHSDWWNLLFMIGLGYRQMGDFIEAKNYFENVLAINPDQVDTLNELGLCLANMGQYDDAIQKFTKGIELKPKDYEILCNRGMTYLQKGSIDKGTVDIENAYNINPQDEITISCMREIERLKDEV